jgi:hypothetical protein
LLSSNILILLHIGLPWMVLRAGWRSSRATVTEAAVE